MICNLVKKFKVQGNVYDLPRHKRANILTEEMKKFIEQEYKKNELTSTAIKALLSQNWPEVLVSISTIKRARRKMGLGLFKATLLPVFV